MQTNVHLPQLELTMAAVTVVKAHVQPGQWVAADQPLIEVESEKAVSTVPSPQAGFVRELLVKPGQPLAENALLCILTDDPDEPFDNPLAPGPLAPPERMRPGNAPRETGSPAGLPGSEAGGLIRAVPAARKLARELGLSLDSIKGTGPGGRITVEDVRRAT